MAAYRVELAGAHQVDGVWPLVSDGLERACLKTGGDTDSTYFWSECRAGRAFLIVVSDDTKIISASVFKFEHWATGRKFKCLAMYGDQMDLWLPQYTEFVKAMARAGGANGLASDARVGFARKVKGAKVLRQLYEVKLDG